MPTSELSDALNPYASQARRGSAINEYSSPSHTHSYQPIVQAPQLIQQPHVPHVSELEMAIVPLPLRLSPRQGAPQVFAELVRIVAATQNAHEAERKRRLAWEEAQEAKAAQKQSDMERKMLEMDNEITMLRSKLDTLSNPPPPDNSFQPTPQFTPSPTLMQQMNINAQPVSPISPVSQPSTFQQPMFIQGSSNNPLSVSGTSYHRQVNTMYSVPQPVISQPQVQDTSDVVLQPGLQSITPDPSPHLAFVETSRPSPSSTGKSTKRKKKRSHSFSSDDRSSSSGSSSSASGRPRKRTSHHDTKCYTIHHAMRLHILRMMDIETDKELPDSHTEGTSLRPSEAVRFVWDKTTKQSVHNGRMKTRVLDAIKDNKRLYKHVPHKEFTKKNLDAAFEQCFVTLRQKFKAQRDGLTAESQKKREDGKARKARHLSRRKIKLNNRSESRNKIAMFEHVTFDGALQLDCMSSEESDFELDPHSSQRCPVLKTRGYGWRSTRLLRFYYSLDDEDREEASSKPKQGRGKKERRVGPTKEEFVLPPQGVATWMISRRWYKASLASYQDLPETLNKLIVDPLGFNWAHFHELGDETADEEDVNTYNPHMHSMNIEIPQQHYDPSSYTMINYTL
ncbi:hypothetical protein BDZ97DRAFT_1647498 [Flammula alnicola]|nr:hypothetical protein BDZ97DRAFT_1647498 [Flammula alnicola]